MGIANGYATLLQIKNRINSLGMSTDATDDATIENMVEQASRVIDGYCGGRTFYARTETHYFNTPDGLQLDLDDDLLTVTTLTNGDATVVTSSKYFLIDRNKPPYYEIKLRASSGIIWQLDSNGDEEQAISLAGSWGYVDRAATDARSVMVIRNTEEACILIVLNEYHRLSGENVSGTTIVTAAGVVITPQGIPQKAADLIRIYARGNQ
jgi:hypothetical protein